MRPVQALRQECSAVIRQRFPQASTRLEPRHRPRYTGVGNEPAITLRSENSAVKFGMRTAPIADESQAYIGTGKETPSAVRFGLGVDGVSRQRLNGGEHPRWFVGVRWG
jgi:hypothetical protein